MGLVGIGMVWYEMVWYGKACPRAPTLLSPLHVSAGRNSLSTSADWRCGICVLEGFLDRAASLHSQKFVDLIRVSSSKTKNPFFQSK